MTLAAGANGPLAGLIVLDLTRVLAGPYCTMILGDLGARIIKVEIPPHGDDTRGTGPFAGDDPATRTSGYFFSVNRNKESIALDLKAEADRRLFEQLLANADVVVENFTPGTMERLGYGWTNLHALHPRLILASISGFGQTGPYRTLPAYDMVVQAMGGIMSLTGEAGGAPTRVGVSIGDLAAGMFGAIGVQAALIDRSTTGVGRHVDVAMLDAQVALLENAIARVQLEDRVPGPIGSRHPSITPFGLFDTATQPMVIAAGNDPMFTRLCDALGRSDLPGDPRFATNAERTRHHAELKAEIEAALSKDGCDAWIVKLRSANVACGALNKIDDLLKDAHLNARDMLMPLPLPSGDQLRVAASPVKFHPPFDSRYAPAPRYDEHGAALRAELAKEAS